MERKVYNKPEMKFVALRGANAVADTCWAYANNNKDFYYDWSGTGYLKINMVKAGTGGGQGTGGCDGGTIAYIEYYEKYNGQGSTTLPDGAETEVRTAVKNAMGNSAEPFADSNSIFGKQPNPSWS